MVQEVAGVKLKLYTVKRKNTKLYVTIVTLSTKDNAKLAEHISYRFKHCVYGKEYRNKSEKVIYRESNIDI